MTELGDQTLVGPCVRPSTHAPRYICIYGDVVGSTVRSWEETLGWIRWLRRDLRSDRPTRVEDIYA